MKSCTIKCMSYNANLIRSRILTIQKLREANSCKNIYFNAIVS